MSGNVRWTPDEEALLWEYYCSRGARWCSEEIERRWGIYRGRCAVKAKAGVLKIPGPGKGAQFFHPEPTTKRRCLGCSKTFDSWGAGNRLCSSCGKQASADLPVAWRALDGRHEFVSA